MTRFDPAMAGTATPILEHAPLRVLIYLSIASGDVGAYETAASLARAVQHANQRREVTGLLLGNGRSYMQLLEGQAANVEAAFATIKNDPRHRSIETVLERTVIARNFPESAMLGLDLVSSPFERRRAIAGVVPETAEKDIRTMLLAFSVFD